MRDGRLSTSESTAWWGLLRTYTALVREVDEALRAAHDLSLSSYDVLCEVASARQEGIRMGELAERVMLTPAGLSGLVDRLEAAGLVERRPGRDDARVRYAVITGHGRDVTRLATRTHRDAVRRHYTSRLDDTELGILGGFWERLDLDGRPA